jgi:ectoine hydroxylase-related dioxygenase (phytanoyl-CoA dioxygenase family)
MLRLAAATGAEDLRWISAYISTKEPRSGALWWHQDWWCWDHPVAYRPPAPQIAVLCHLMATDAGNGALRVLPGSHRRSAALHAVLPAAHAESTGELDPEHPAMSDHPGQVTFAAGAGDAVVLDYRLLHGNHPNASDHRRDCLLLTFAPSWGCLPSDIRAHLIRHPAQPGETEGQPSATWRRRLLPRFDGQPRDLALNRVAPARFAVEPDRRTPTGAATSAGRP